jgi:hypothetical protein
MLPALAAALPAIVSGIAALIGTGVSAYSNRKTANQINKTSNDQINEQTRVNNLNLEADKRNYDNMVAQQEYEKALQQTIFNREDTAVQRRTADLKAAGINPILAAGGAAQSGAIVNTEAPRMDQSQKPIDFSSVFTAKQMAHEQKLAEQQMIMNSLTMAANIYKTKAEVDRIRNLNQFDSLNFDLRTEEFGFSKDKFERGLTWDMEQFNKQLAFDKDKQAYVEMSGDRNFNLASSKLADDIARTGLMKIDTANRVAQTLIDADMAALRHMEFGLKKDYYKIDRAVAKARIGLIHADTALRTLEASRIPHQVSLLMLEHQIKSRDLDLSVQKAIRYKDTFSSLRFSAVPGSTLYDTIDRYMDSQARRLLGDF